MRGMYWYCVIWHNWIEISRFMYFFNQSLIKKQKLTTATHAIQLTSTNTIYEYQKIQNKAMLYKLLAN